MTAEKKLITNKSNRTIFTKNLKSLATSSIDTVKSTFFSEEQFTSNSFSYENLQANLGKRINNYALFLLGAYIHFERNVNKKVNKRASVEEKRSIFAAKKQETGWKLHLSVNPQQIDLAWAVIYPILMEFEVSVKIISAEILKSKATEEVSSKQITIYKFKNTHLDMNQWKDLMQKIEDELLQHGINRGTLPTADKQIGNSLYFSYRNDTDPRGQYISAAAAQNYAALHLDLQLCSYNLTKDKDPFEEVILHTNLDHNPPGI